MLTPLNGRKTKQSLTAVLLLGIAALSFSVVSSGSAEPDRHAQTLLPAAHESIAAPDEQFTSASADFGTKSRAEVEVEGKVTQFIDGMRSGDAASVWMFASEEDQEAFETEDAVYAAFAETFPVLTQVREVSYQGFRMEGDTPFVDLALLDGASNPYRADIGLYQDEAGDWKVVSCDIVPASDQLASLDLRS